MDLDFQDLAKIYAPLVVPIMGFLKLYLSREKKREKRHAASIAQAISGCEAERRKDQDECRVKYMELQAKLHEVELTYIKEMGKAFSRMADSVDALARRHGDESGEHRATRDSHR